jgi:hypothetical protein
MFFIFKLNFKELKMKFCGEIQYETNDGGVHSDICYNCNPSNDDRVLTKSYREYLHESLDEWLNKSSGTGYFWVGDPNEIWKEEEK